MDQEIRIVSYKCCELPTKTLKQKIDNWHKNRLMHSFIGRAVDQGSELPKFICKGDKIYG